MATAAMPASTARNLDYYLNRMSGYSKNTIKIQPSSKFEYNAGDTVIFRLPTNSIIDLHTLSLKFSAQIINKLPTPPGAGGAAPTDAQIRGATINASFPRHTASFLRRNDWTMGGMQVGLGSLHDYGYLYTLLANAKTPADRQLYDLNVTDDGNCINPFTNATMAAGNFDVQANQNPGGTPSTFRIVPSGATATAEAGTTNSNPSQWTPKTISNWLGIASGAFMRFLDTNLLPDIEIRLLLAPNSILCTDQVGAAAYKLQGLSLSCESISFGDGSYRAMVDARMASGNPLVVPFFNWSGFEGSATNQNITQQFTIATESLNAIMGTIRPGNYDAQTLPQIGSIDTVTGTASQTGTSRFNPQTGADPAAIAGLNTGTSITGIGLYNWYHAALSGERCVADQFGLTGLWSANYQFNIDSKLYPQFLADAHDAWHMMRNMLDANALSLTYGGAVSTLDQFTQAMFLFCVGLDHHADDSAKDHLISGLNTTGSLIPITFNVNMSNNGAWWTRLRNMCGGSFRPTVFANLTSTLMIYQGRTISVVN